jgi:hypothetical protein
LIKITKRKSEDPQAEMRRGWQRGEEGTKKKRRGARSSGGIKI